MLRLPSAYPSSRVAQLGNALGYCLPRLSALDSGRGWCFAAPGYIFERHGETEEQVNFSGQTEIHFPPSLRCQKTLEVHTRQ